MAHSGFTTTLRNTQTAPEQGRTRLGLTAAQGDLDAFDEAIDEGLSPEQQDDYGETPLHLAAAHGQVNMIKVLVKEYKLTVGCQNFEGWTPLFCALAHGHVDAARALIKHGAKADHVTSAGHTALHIAAWHGQTECVDWLVKHGMSATQTNRFACTPFDMAPPGDVRRTLFEHMQGSKRAQKA